MVGQHSTVTQHFSKTMEFGEGGGCHSHLLPQSSAATVICCHSHLLPQSSAATVICCHSHLLPQSSAATVICCHSHLLPQSSAATIICCHSHLLPQSSAATVICCHNHLLPQSSAATVICCNSYLLPRPSAVTVICCRFLADFVQKEPKRGRAPETFISPHVLSKSMQIKECYTVSKHIDTDIFLQQGDAHKCGNCIENRHGCQVSASAYTVQDVCLRALLLTHTAS